MTRPARSRRSTRRERPLALSRIEGTGGLLLAAGLLTPLAAALMIATMTAAVITVHAKNGPWATDQGWELNVLYGLIGFAVAGIGAVILGRFSERAANAPSAPA